MTIIIAIAGSSGSGKSTVAKEICDFFNQRSPKQCIIISADKYYKDLRHLSSEARDATNFDDPKSLEWSLLAEHLRALKAGKPVELPTYDFTTHCRTNITETMSPAPIILVEGILLLASKALSPLWKLKLFIDTPPELCFIQRLKRDVEERGRTPDGVIQQYLSTVRPADLEYVRKYAPLADIVLENKTPYETSADGFYFDITRVITEMMPFIEPGAIRLPNTRLTLFPRDASQVPATAEAPAWDGRITPPV